MSKCKTVTLRKRKIKNGTQYSLCLDYYPGYRDNVTMRVITREALGIYIFAKPANQQERDFNARMMKKAVILRNQRYEAIFNENNGFFDKTKMKGDFLAYFKGLADRKNIKWQHVYKHFQRFVNGKCTFEEVDVDLCRKFMEYLLDAPQSIHTNQKLHINSAAGYWSTFRAVLHTAYRDRKIKENPNGFLDRIECIPTIREHLSQEELIRLAETPCEEEVLKKAFLFACLTGLRKSDIRQLTWQQIQPYTNGRMFVTTRMQKTKEIVHNPISDEAYGPYALHYLALEQIYLSQCYIYRDLPYQMMHCSTTKGSSFLPCLLLIQEVLAFLCQTFYILLMRLSHLFVWLYLPEHDAFRF